METVAAVKPTIRSISSNAGERRTKSKLQRIAAWLEAWRRVIVAEILCFTSVEIV